MPERGPIVVYVTSHGFGHLNRSVAVINQIPAAIPVAIRCHPDLFNHWSERLTRPADLGPHVSDSGAVNPPGDSAATDGPASIERAGRVLAEARAKLDDETDWLRDARASAVLCDLPFLPFVAARRAGVPAYGLGNFTWSEIYAPHAKRLGPEARAVVAEIRAAYRAATGLFRCDPALRMAEFRSVEDVGMVVGPARDRRAELRDRLGLSSSEKLIYFYIG
ncbi:MAG: hypothetical protein K2X91_02295, partial [Thermoleophilia bacterium]|nr:hypothetical protein [Thermoleophilia bacterium]